LLKKKKGQKNLFFSDLKILDIYLKYYVACPSVVIICHMASKKEVKGEENTNYTRSSQAIPFHERPRKVLFIDRAGVHTHFRMGDEILLQHMKYCEGGLS